MIEFERKYKRRKEPNLISMINIIFMILIFFLIAGNVEKFELIDYNPPIARSGKVIEEGEVEVVMGRLDELIINDEMVIDIKDFVPMMRGALASNPDKIITLKADEAIPSPNLIAIMDRIKQAGGKNVSLVVQKIEEDE